MSIFGIENLKIEKSYDKKYLVFTGEFRKRLFFGTNENGKFEIINDNNFYDFEEEYIIKCIDNYLRK